MRLYSMTISNGDFELSLTDPIAIYDMYEFVASMFLFSLQYYNLELTSVQINPTIRYTKIASKLISLNSKIHGKKQVMPRFANSTAVALPIPPAPPVIRAYPPSANLTKSALAGIEYVQHNRKMPISFGQRTNKPK